MKRTKKQERERKILLGLVEHYLRIGKPVGSKTLKDAEFGDLSSATIRNYFANLEKEGYLSQQHASGGRIPTDAAYRLYAQEHLETRQTTPDAEEQLHPLKNRESREVATYLQHAAETLSHTANLAIFLSAPRFDHDYISDLKLVPIDNNRCLCVLITDFGVIQTELLHLDRKLSTFSTKRIEAYFRWRLSGCDKPKNLEAEEEALGQKIYNELMIRYIVSYSNFIDEEIYRTGFSKLLAYPDFQDATTLANSLALFENAHSMRLLLRECTKTNALKFWIGDDLSAYSAATPSCAVLTIPYCVNQRPVGAIGLLGPLRMPYKELFGLMRIFSENVSEALTRSLYKFKITFREPEEGMAYLQKEEHRLLDQSRLMLLEDKRKE